MEVKVRRRRNLTSPKYTAPNRHFQKYASQKYMPHWQGAPREGARGACEPRPLCARLYDGCRRGMPPRGSSMCAARPYDVE